MNAEAPNPYQAPQVDTHVTTHSADGDAPLATRGSRFLAATIDGLISLAVVVPIQFALGIYEGFPNIQQPSFMTTLLLSAGAFVFWMAVHGKLLMSDGQTIGKRVMGIQMVEVESDLPAPFQTLVVKRYLPVSIAAIIPGIGGFLTLVDALFIFRKDQRCLHDLIAGTRVIDRRR